jgi:hypothetical protein
MSTQRQEGRLRPASIMGSASILRQEQSALFARIHYAQVIAFSILLFIEARMPSGFFFKRKPPCRTSKWQSENRKYSGGGTAPPNGDRLATNSLQSDYLTTELVRHVLSSSGTRPPGPTVASEPSGERSSGHPFRTSPSLPVLRISSRPSRLYPQL